MARGQLTARVRSGPARTRPGWSPVAPARHDVRRALAVALAALAVVAVAALVTAVGFAAAARRSLDFGFAGTPSGWSETIGLFLHNARLTCAIVAAVLGVQSLRLGGAADTLGPNGRTVRTVVDVALAAVVGVNAAVVGVCVGAYGSRMVVALFPHGPVEVVAYALALALYLRAREERLRLRPTTVLAAWAVVLLALAALLEAPPPL